ncbi:MAG: hypothetical protein AABZ30_15610 [Myxococcota bacterium]
MGSDDITVEILRGIRSDMQGVRQEMQAMCQEQHATNERLDATNERLDRLGRRQTETEVRLSTELVAVAKAVNDVRDLLRENLSVRGEVADHERRIGALERRPG